MTIGLPLLKDSLDSPLSQHFGKAKWLLVYQSPERYQFLRNTGLSGHFVVQALVGAGCTDVVILHAGSGAWGHLQQGGVRTWLGEPGVPARDLVRRLEEGGLARAEPPDEDDPSSHGENCTH
jgi:predicted Fe-Mo cluster-binding NifX family protein